MNKWKCSICKYVHKGDSLAESCPVCGAEKSKFDLLGTEPVKAVESTDPSNQPKKWKCVVCGYIHTGDEPPEICPVCGADKSQFVLLESTPEKEVEAKPTAPTESQSEVGLVSRLAAQLKLLTDLHGHPIAVHIPNGVLPLTVIFTIIAVIFKSHPMAIAAKLNVLFVAISMPAVLFTGMIDWHNRYAGRMSPVFKVKIACGAVVTILTFIIGLWWIVSPDVYLKGSIGTGIFCLLNIADLIVAAVAGFYGGKLVFNKI